MTDLLHDGRRVGAWHGVAHRRVLDGGCEVDLSPDATEAELLELLQAAEDRKRRAATAMNERSSRAHSVLILRLIQRDTSHDGEAVESTICFADLGGSEQVCCRAVCGHECGMRAVGAKCRESRLSLVAVAVGVQVLKSKVASCSTAAGGFLAKDERLQVTERRSSMGVLVGRYAAPERLG